MRPIRSFWAFLLLGGGLFVFASCEGFVKPSYNAFEKQRVFWAYSMNNVTGGYYSCPSSLLATGNSCLVYGENSRNIPEAFAREVADEFDTRIYSGITGAFGFPSDWDNNGRVIILLHKIDEDTSGGAYTAGYFNAADLFNYDRSNLGEMLYINYKSPEIENPGFVKNLYSAMAHELQHLINRSLHLTNPMDLWIDEGLASAAEYLYGGSQADRIAWFNKDEQETIRKGNNFFIWNGYWEGVFEEDEEQPPKTDVLGNYATAYLFFQWLRIHADKGSEIYRDIINSPYTDYRAVARAAWQNIPGFRGIAGGNDEDWEDAEWSNKAWAELLGAWYAANRLRAESGIYGYEGEITLDFTWSWPETNTHDVDLYPGEGVYSQISSGDNKSPTAGAPVIRYLGLNSPDDPDKSPPYDTTYLLTYNGSVGVVRDPGGKDESGKTTGYAADLIPVPASPLRSAAAGSGGISESPEAILRRWDGGRVFLEKLRENGILPRN
jgi:hypothetical protein